METLKLKVVGVYDGYNIKKNYSINLKLRVAPDEVANAMQFVMAVGKPIDMALKVNENKMRIGHWWFDGLRINRDGEGVLSLVSQTEDTTFDCLNDLLTEEAPITIAGLLREVVEADE